MMRMIITIVTSLQSFEWNNGCEDETYDGMEYLLSAEQWNEIRLT